MKELIKVEWYKFCHRKVMLLSFLSIPFLIALSYLYFSKNNIRIAQIDPNAVNFASNISFPYLVIQEQLMLVVSILVVFYVSIIITGELRSGEVKSTLSRGYDRWKLILSKIIVIAGVFLILFVECFVLSELVANLFMPKVDFAYTFFSYKKIHGFSAFIYTLKFYALAYLSVISMLSLMSFIAVMVKNKAVMVGVGIGVLLMGMLYSCVITMLYRAGIIKSFYLIYGVISQIQFTGIATILGGVKNASSILLSILMIYIIIFVPFTLLHEKIIDYVD